MKKLKTYASLLFTMVLICSISYAQDNLTSIDLSKVGDSNNWEVFNRKVSIGNENDDVVMHFNTQPGDGFARLKNREFTNGIIDRGHQL